VDAARQALVWKRELGIPDSHRVILFAGKLETKKRPRDLVSAFGQAGQRDTTLLMVGNGELEEELRGKAETLKAEMRKRDSRTRGQQQHGARVVFAPFQNQSQMPRTYAAADLFVLPSYGTGETWGLAVNEAMCMGLPVIVSDHVGCAQDLVHPGRNGLVFPAGDVAALAGALREAFADGARLKAWGLASREFIQGYSYEQATQGLLLALAKLRAPGSIVALSGSL
jgi:glycosyltransferase involved in cell wall biosynthesis